MGCLITRNIFGCPDFNLGGAGTLYITNRSLITDYYFDIGGDGTYSTITEFIPNNIPWWEFTFDPTATGGGETENITLNGITYTQRFTARFNKLSPESRAALKRLIESRDLIILFKDKNDIWWCIGEDKKCRVTEYQAITGNSDEEGGNYVLTVQLTSKYQMREVDSNFVDLFITPTTAGGGGITPGVCPACADIIGAANLNVVATVALSCAIPCTLQ